MCGNCVACNAAIARAQYRTDDIRFEMSNQAETDANFISLYFLFSTSIQCKFCIIRMRSISSTIWYNYVIIICWDARVATTARSHYIKNIVLMFVKVRFKNLVTFLFENWIFQLIRTNSNRLSLFIQRSRILSISRSIIRKIRICFYREFLSTENDAYLLLNAFIINITTMNVQNHEIFSTKLKKLVTMKKLKKKFSKKFHKNLNNWNFRKINKISFYKKWNQRINLKFEFTSSIKKTYEFSRNQITVVKHYINDMLNKNFIRFNYFDYFFSILIVKKSKKWI